MARQKSLSDIVPDAAKNSLVQLMSGVLKVIGLNQSRHDRGLVNRRAFFPMMELPIDLNAPLELELSGTYTAFAVDGVWLLTKCQCFCSLSCLVYGN